MSAAGKSRSHQRGICVKSTVPEPSARQVEMWSQLGAAKHSHKITLLVPLARELARTAGEDGCTVADLRIVAVQRGLLSGREKGRELSYLGAVMRAAGLVRTEQFRRSIVERSHGNLHRIFRRSA